MVGNQTRSPRDATTSRRTALRLAGGIAAASLAGCLGSADDEIGSHDDWRSLGHNDGNTGVTPADGPGDPDGLWQVDTSPIGTSPVVADDIVYAGTADGTLYALDLETGDELWTYVVDDGVYYPPTVDGETVYVAAEDAIHAITTDGDEEWVVDLEGDVSAASACTVSDGRVHVSTSGRLLTLAADSGDELWRGQGNGLDSTPAVVDGTVYAAGDIDEFDEDGEWEGADTGVVALEADSGDERWQYTGQDSEEQVPPPLHGPSIGDDRVYLGTSGAESDRLVALDRSTGDEQWRASLSGYVTHPPVVGEETIYVAVTPTWTAIRLDQLEDADPASVVAIDAETGERQWQRDVDTASAALGMGSETIYCRTLDGLVALDPESGDPRWQHDAPFGLAQLAADGEEEKEEEGTVSLHDTTSQPAILEGAVVVTSPAGGVYAVGEH